MPNLLSRDPITEAHALAEVYVVWDNKDYRMTLETLVSLVTKASLGLANVNNTSDVNKPISNATAAALAQKANTDDVVSNAAFATFQQTLQNYVTLQQLNVAIDEVVALINNSGGLTQGQVQSLIDVSLQPITSALQQLQHDLQSQADEITALQTQAATFETKDNVTTKLSQLEQSLGSQISSVAQGMSQTIAGVAQTSASEITRLEDAAAARTLVVNQQIQSLVNQFDAVGLLITGLRTDLTNHTHNAGDIVGLQSVIEALMSEYTPPGSEMVVGSLQW